MRVRVVLDRDDRTYHYDQVARMRIFADNDGKVPVVVHMVEVRFSSKNRQKITLSRRVEPGESEYSGETSMVIGVWTVGQGALFEARVFYSAREEHRWSTKQDKFDQGSLNVEAAPQNGKTVFISHSNKDRALVDRVVEALRLYGFAPYLAEDHKKPGENLWDKIIDSMIGSSTMLIVWTKNGKASHDVQTEIGCALMLRRLRPSEGFEIIPAVTDEAGIPGGSLAGYECVRIDDGIDGLVDGVRKSLGMGTE